MLKIETFWILLYILKDNSTAVSPSMKLVLIVWLSGREATEIHENCFTSAKCCVASQTELEGDTEALCHGLSQMQRWQHASSNIFPRVCFFLRGSKNSSTQAVTSARSLRMSPPAQTVPIKELHFHLFFPWAAHDPSWFLWVSYTAAANLISLCWNLPGNSRLPFRL